MDVSASATMNNVATCDKRWRAAGPREPSVFRTHHAPSILVKRYCRHACLSVVILLSFFFIEKSFGQLLLYKFI